MGAEPGGGGHGRGPGTAGLTAPPRPTPRSLSWVTALQAGQGALSQVPTSPVSSAGTLAPHLSCSRPGPGSACTQTEGPSVGTCLLAPARAWCPAPVSQSALRAPRPQPRPGSGPTWSQRGLGTLPLGCWVLAGSGLFGPRPSGDTESSRGPSSFRGAGRRCTGDVL